MILHLANWALWLPGIADPAAYRAWCAAGRPSLSEDDAPTVPFLAPMVRRRLSRHVRMALHVAHAALADSDPTACRSIFASRHGEVARTVGLLDQVVAREPLSPTDFAMSVHNTGSGQFSIWARNHQPTTAIAAGPETVAAALLEAAGTLARDPATPLLLVLSDEALPPRFAMCADEAQMSAALALRFTAAPGPATRRLHLNLSSATAPATAPVADDTAADAAPTQLHRLIDWLAQAATATAAIPRPALILALGGLHLRLDLAGSAMSLPTPEAPS